MLEVCCGWQPVWRTPACGGLPAGATAIFERVKTIFSRIKKDKLPCRLEGQLPFQIERIFN
jgi:hypothetical protein